MTTPDLKDVAVLGDATAEPGPQTIVLPQMQEDVQRLSDLHPGSHMIGMSVEMSATEAAVGLLIGKLKGVIEAFYKMRGQGLEVGADKAGYARNVSHLADGTAALCRNYVYEAHNRCAKATEDDPRCIEVQRMLFTLRQALFTVDIARNSAPVLAVCRLFYQCAHGILSGDTSLEVKDQARLAWRDKLGKCMRV